jgi:hypothetical protein
MQQREISYIANNVVLQYQSVIWISGKRDKSCVQHGRIYK